MSGRGYRHGFKTYAERLALEVRGELGLGPHDPLDPRRLAAHLAIEVLTLDQVRALGAPEPSVRHFLSGPGREEFSAVTIFVGTVRVIVENEAHARGRRANSVAHEISHVLLEHEPHGVRGREDQRPWLPEMEREATWLGAALLVSKDAALRVARAQADVDTAAERFGVSPAVMSWRLNETGALIRARREWGRRNGA